MSLDSSEYIDLRDAVNDSDMESDIKEKLLAVLRDAANEDDDDEEDDDEEDPQIYTNDDVTVDLSRVVACRWSGTDLHVWVEGSGPEPFDIIGREDGEKFLKRWREWLK
jgi:hypothetical protein